MGVFMVFTYVCVCVCDSFYALCYVEMCMWDSHEMCKYIVRFEVGHETSNINLFDISSWTAKQICKNSPNWIFNWFEAKNSIFFFQNEWILNKIDHEYSISIDIRKPRTISECGSLSWWFSTWWNSLEFVIIQKQHVWICQWTAAHCLTHCALESYT